MPEDWKQLVLKAKDTVTCAQTYLRGRAGGKAGIEESKRFIKWDKTLEKSVCKLMPREGEFVHLKDLTGKIISEQLDLSQRHLEELHREYNYSSLELVVRALNHHLKTLTGPITDGKGRP